MLGLYFSGPVRMLGRLMAAPTTSQQRTVPAHRELTSIIQNPPSPSQVQDFKPFIQVSDVSILTLEKTKRINVYNLHGYQTEISVSLVIVWFIVLLLL